METAAAGAAGEALDIPLPTLPRLTSTGRRPLPAHELLSPGLPMAPPPPQPGLPLKQRRLKGNGSLSLSVPEEAKTPYSLSAAGVFSEGDLTISRTGLQIREPTAADSGTFNHMLIDTPSPVGVVEGSGPSGIGSHPASGGGIGTGGLVGIGPSSSRASTPGGPGVWGDRESQSSRGGHGGSDAGAGSRLGSSGGTAPRDGLSGAGPTAGRAPPRSAGSGEPTSRGSAESVDGLFDTITLEDLKPIGVVGTGSSGVVQRVRHVSTGDILAVKVIQMDVAEAARKQILMELRTLRQSSYRHIVPCFGAFFSEGAVSIVLEYMDGGSLTDLVRANGPLPEKYLAEICRQVLLGLLYLHKDLHVVHRDVKPSNLLVNRRGEVKISDFGVSGQLANSVSKCRSWVGTVTYMSPERISGKPYSYDSDLWSLGLTLVECALGRFPYPPPSDTASGAAEPPPKTISFWDLLDYIVEHPPPTLPQGGPHSDGLRAFVAACLQKDPRLRPPVAELLDHPWLKSFSGAETNVADLIPSPRRDGGAKDNGLGGGGGAKWPTAASPRARAPQSPRAPGPAA